MGILELFGLRRGPQCALCRTRTAKEAGRVVVRARSDESMMSVIFGADERFYLGVLKSLGLHLERLDDIRKDVFVCNTCLADRVMPVAQKDVKVLMARLQKRIKEEKNLASSADIESLGGLGEAGVPAAFWGLLDLYELCGKESVEPINIPFWVETLAHESVNDACVAAKDFDKRRAILVSECLCKRFAELSYYSWGGWLEAVETLVCHGIPVSDAVRKIVFELSAKSDAELAKDFTRAESRREFMVKAQQVAQIFQSKSGGQRPAE